MHMYPLYMTVYTPIYEGSLYITIPGRVEAQLGTPWLRSWLGLHMKNEGNEAKMGKTRAHTSHLLGEITCNAVGSVAAAAATVRCRAVRCKVGASPRILPLANGSAV